MTDRPEDSEHPCIGGNVRIQAMCADLLASSSLIPDWPTPPGVRALTTLRGPLGGSQGAYARFNIGTRAGDDPAIVHGNRCDLAAGACLRSWPHWLHQVHGTRVWQADALLPWPQRWDTPHAEPDADAAITRTPGVVLAILSADCLPVLIATRDGSVVAAAHAGWRGLAEGVLEAAIAALRVVPAGLLAWIGPGIGAASYEVDARVRAAFVDADADAAQAFHATRPGHWQCDLAALARLRLRRCGVADVYGGDFDTFSDARFYSYRRDGADSGRMATLIWREG